MGDERPIYLDYQAHAPLDPRVAARLARSFVEDDANPHSTHVAGEAARRAADRARMQVADLIGAESSEIVFTSGATEANNMAFAGIRERLRELGVPRVLVSAGEHPSVISAARASFADVGILPLTGHGVVDLPQLERSLGGVGLVSVAAANHEIGTIQPLCEISRMVRAAGALFHSDLAQAAGRLALDASDFDLASISSHKLSGPVGVGALFVRRSLRRHLRPLLHGGGQEGGIRSGTLPVPLCVGFGEACALARGNMEPEAGRIAGLRDDLLGRLRKLGGVSLNGGTDRLACNLNVSFDGVDAEALMLRLRGKVLISTGSACTSSSLEPSSVLAAIGVTGRRAEQAVRISLGRFTTFSEIEAAAAAIAEAVTTLRASLRRVA